MKRTALLSILLLLASCKGLQVNTANQADSNKLSDPLNILATKTVQTVSPLDSLNIKHNEKRSKSTEKAILTVAGI